MLQYRIHIYKLALTIIELLENRKKTQMWDPILKMLGAFQEMRVSYQFVQLHRLIIDAEKLDSHELLYSDKVKGQNHKAGMLLKSKIRSRSPHLKVKSSKYQKSKFKSQKL